jgi:hypothetical protein
MAAQGAAPGVRPASLDAPDGLLPSWENRDAASALGPWAWIRARLGDRPVRVDRSRALEGEPGGRLGRLDAWVLVVLVISLLSVRMWRLSEPYGMHFDEVYHARTATEFLQPWRYGISQYIYEWTHPHLAKYAMALGIEAWGDDRTRTTSTLGVAVAGVAIEPRWDDAGDAYARKGDRLWVATGDAVLAYDLETRALAGTVSIPGASSVAVDRQGHRAFVGMRPAHPARRRPARRRRSCSSGRRSSACTCSRTPRASRPSCRPARRIRSPSSTSTPRRSSAASRSST